MKIKSTVQQDTNKDLFIEIPEEFLISAGFTIEDELEWTTREDGSFFLSKVEKDEHIETEFVLVECIQQQLVKYVVEVPKGNHAMALDVVVYGEASEFSQVDIGESIISHRSLSVAEIIDLCDNDNEELQTLSVEQKMSSCVTFMDEYI
jgi:hypothetical protein